MSNEVELAGVIEGLGIVEVAGWSGMIGVYMSWGASSARTKAAESPPIVDSTRYRRIYLEAVGARRRP